MVHVMRDWPLRLRPAQLADAERKRNSEYVRNIVIIVVMATLTLIATLVLVALLVCVKQSQRHSRRPARRGQQKRRAGDKRSVESQKVY